jgi:membrane-anchored protein YejM (alkaline phosphatase superfamily)
MFRHLTNWFSGIFLVLIGVCHVVSGGPVISRWLQTASPPIPHRGLVVGRIGFETGGYLAIAIGLTFLVLGHRLPRDYYLFWAIIFLILGGLSVYSFGSFHLSQLVWLLTILLGAYYFSSSSTSHE